MEMRGRPNSRRPWYWLAIVAVLALAGIAAIAENMRTRIAANDAHFSAAQRLRLQRADLRLGSVFGDDEQLCLVGAQAAGGVSGNFAQAEQLVAEMFHARKSKD